MNGLLQNKTKKNLLQIKLSITILDIVWVKRLWFHNINQKFCVHLIFHLVDFESTTTDFKSFSYVSLFTYIFRIFYTLQNFVACLSVNVHIKDPSYVFNHINLIYIFAVSFYRLLYRRGLTNCTIAFSEAVFISYIGTFVCGSFINSLKL